MQTTWMWVTAGGVAVAVAIPLLKKLVVRRDPEKVAAERRERDQCIADAERMLATLAEASREGVKTQTGPGSALHDEMTQLRQRLRHAFPLSATSEFDRTIGFELSRPGLLALSRDNLQTRIDHALRVLREARGS